MRSPTASFPVLLALLALILCAAPALAENALPAGSVRNATGDVQLLRAGQAPAKLAVGDRIYEKDVLTTGKDGALGLVMRDNATVSLGSNSRLSIERYLFEPEKNRLGSLLNLSRGSMAQVSGEIAKLRPEEAKVQSPIFTIGIRGTYFAVSLPEGTDQSASQPGEGR